MSNDTSKPNITVDLIGSTPGPIPKPILEAIITGIDSSLSPGQGFILITFPVASEIQISAASSVPPILAREVMEAWRKAGYPFN